MSLINVDTIESRTGGPPTLSQGVVVSAAATFSGDVSIGGTLTYEDVTNIDVVGLITARNGIKFGAAGIGGTIAANGNTTLAGVVTATGFVGDVTGDLTGTVNTAAQTNITSVGTLTGLVVNGDTEFGASGVGGTITAVGNAILSGITTVGTGLTLADNVQARFGNAGDIKIYHDATNSYIQNETNNLFLKGDAVNIRTLANQQVIETASGGSVELFEAGSKKLETLTTGVKVTGVTSTTSFTVGPGIIQEKQYTVASALTGTVNMDVVTNGLVQSYTTNAAASFVVNLRGDGSTTFNSLMHIGQASVFTLYHASNNTSYYMTDFQIDGSSITEKWNGGSAPTAATGSGTDAYTFNIMKTADATFTVFANFSNFA